MLGPLEIAHEGRSIAPSAAKDRAFLGELLAHPGQLISAEHLADVLWPDRPPANPANAVQVRVSRLRTLLRSVTDAETAAQILRTRPGGYELSLDLASTDVARFEEAISRADEAALREGLSLWRGAPFSDVPQTPCIEMQVARLEELRLSAVESYADRCLAEDAFPATLIADLAEQATRNPLREPLHYRLIRALHMSGRSAEALTIYERLRRTLADELGTDPQPELRRLHLEMVAEDDPDAVDRAAFPTTPATASQRAEPSLTDSDAHVTASKPAPRRRLPWIAAIGLGCLLGLGIGGFWFLGDQSKSGVTLPRRPIPGDSSRLDADVTYPDGSSVKAGERFVKTWKITNTGSVPWHARMLTRQAIKPGVEGCRSATTIAIPDTEPGRPVLISVTVQAPSTPGRCKVYWKMVDAQGIPYMPQLRGIFFDVNVVS